MTSKKRNRIKYLLGVALAGIVLTCSSCTRADVKSNYPVSIDNGVSITETIRDEDKYYVDYKTKVQVMQDAVTFGADTSSFNLCEKNYILKANKEEPIYTYIDKDFSNSQVQAINQVLDSFNETFQKVNPAYNFKVVSESEANVYDAKGLTTIAITNETINEGGQIYRQWLTEKNSSDYYINKANIKMDLDFINEYHISDTTFKSIFYHEMAHAVGFEDVYNNEIGSVVTNTTTNTLKHRNHAELDQRLTPNDYKMLYAKYYHIDNSSNSNYNQSVIKAKTDIANYESEFYALTSKEYTHIASNQIMNESTLNWTFDVNSSRTYKVAIKDDKYCIAVVSQDNSIIEKVSGKCVRQDDMLFLTNAKFNEASLCGFTEQVGFIGDLIVYQKDASTVALNVLNGPDIEFTAVNKIVQQVNSINPNAVEFTNEDFNTINNSMWFLTGSNNQKFAFAICNSFSKQRTSSGFAIMDNNISSDGIEMKGFIVGADNEPADGYIYKAKDGHIYLHIDGLNEFDLLENKQEFNGNIFMSINLNDSNGLTK